MISTVQEYRNFAIINMEGDAFPQNLEPLNCGFFMQKQTTEQLPEMRQDDVLRLSYFDLQRPDDWVGHERELMLELDAPGCYITKPCPVQE